MVEVDLQFCYFTEGSVFRKLQDWKNKTQTSAETEGACVYPEQDFSGMLFEFFVFPVCKFWGKAWRQITCYICLFPRIGRYVGSYFSILCQAQFFTAGSKWHKICATVVRCESIETTGLSDSCSPLRPSDSLYTWISLQMKSMQFSARS